MQLLDVHSAIMSRDPTLSIKRLRPILPRLRPFARLSEARSGFLLHARARIDPISLAREPTRHALTASFTACSAGTVRTGS
jgi:hypothetical protein